MATYRQNKERAREIAKDWQQWESENVTSWEGAAIACGYFENLAKRYGLTKEFKENGII